MKLGSTTRRSGSQPLGTRRAMLWLLLSAGLSLVLTLAALTGPESGRAACLFGAALCDAAALLSAIVALRQLGHGEADRVGERARHDIQLSEQRAAASESIRQHAEALQARDKAEAASRARDNFIALFDHELRNPLGAISSAVRVLQNERPGTERSRNALDIITRQNDRLGQLQKDLIDASQLVSGEARLARHPMDLADAARRAATALGLEGATGLREVVIQLQPAWISGDAMRIDQIARQALGSVMRSVPTGRRVRLEVGVDADQAFLRMRDEDGVLSSSRQPPGQSESAPEAARASLGSTLTQRLVELHGGTTKIDPAGFEMRLPAITPPVAEAALASRSPARSVALIQGGDAAVALQSRLARDGHDVSRHDEALGGLQAVVGQRPEVTIVDLALPGLGGFDLARRSRAAGYAGLMIAISSAQAPPDVQRAMQAGFDAHLPEPVDAERLLELIRQHC